MSGAFPLPPARLLPFLYLASPSLPVGAFSWSQGLAPACAANLVHNAASLREWLMNVLRFGLGNLDVPILFRCCGAAAEDDAERFFYWNDMLLAGRESAELWSEEDQMGKALCRLLRGQRLLPAWMNGRNCGYVAAFALGATRLCASLGVGHSAGETACAFVWSWLENQAVCACKCLPLGQTAVQHILLDIMPHIPKILDKAARRKDDEVGASLPGLAIASAAHERLYGRMFRS
ncbi:MAG: urease accessory protein UreF [Desulfovibrio sp.]|jgi:urease accessory protein|nr:urease accessory protein UreF [Desulfovibrio sp.]